MRSYLGGLGVHRFYLGQTGLGLAYLLFCWTFVPSIVALIDGIIFLTMDADAFNLKYNNGMVVPAPVHSGFASSNSMNTADELEKLHTLKEKGAITLAEYEARKAKLL